MILSIPTTFVAQTLIKSADMNSNFTTITSWANGNIQDNNFGTFAGPLTWSVSSNQLCISASSAANTGMASFSQTSTLLSTSSILAITSSAALTAGYGGLFVNLQSVSASIPTARFDNAGTGNALQLNQTGTGTALHLTQSGNSIAQIIANSGTSTGLQINDTGTQSGNALALDVESTTKPAKPAPAMTTTQKNAITGLVDGALVYDTTLKALQYYNTTSSAWQSVGFATETLIAKTAAYTLTALDSTVSVNATTGAVTITLPTAIGIAGKLYRIKKTDSSANGVTVATALSQTIDGSTTLAMYTQNDSVTVQSDGTNWVVVAQNITVAASYTCNTTQTLSFGAVHALVCYGQANFDTHSAFNSSTGIYTVPVAGKYRVSLQVISNSTITATAGVGSQFQAILQKNSSTFAQGFMLAQTTSAVPYYAQVSDTISCAANDTLGISAFASLAVSGNYVLGNSISSVAQFCVERVGN